MAADIPFPLAGRRIWVAGHTGMVGQAMVRRLTAADAIVLTVSRGAVDLRDQAAVATWLAEARPDGIVLAAALVGGIEANRTRPFDFIADNLAIAQSVLLAADRLGIDRVLALGAGCMYPRAAEQPIREDSLLTGPLEPTNHAFAVAKLATLELIQAARTQKGRRWIAAIPANLYGPGDNFDPLAAHVIPALIAKAEAALKAGGPLEIWGTGRPEREFLHVDDAADALTFLLERFDGDGPINVSGGETVSIADLARLVADAVGYRGPLAFTPDRPDGMPKKALHAGRIQALGWAPRIDLADGIARTVAWYRDAKAAGTLRDGSQAPASGTVTA